MKFSKHRNAMFWATGPVIGMLVFANGTNAQTTQSQILCDGPDSTADQMITGCTSSIQSGQLHGHDLVSEFYNRGLGYIQRGLAKGDRSDLNHAIANYNQAITLDPKDARPYAGRGDAYSFLLYYDRAIADYSQAIALDPKDARPYAGRGNAYFLKNDYDRAIADYSQAITLDPKDARPYAGRGNAYFLKNNYDRAIADYNQAITINPKDAGPYDGRGSAYKAKGDFDHAIADFNEAIRLYPQFGNSYIDRGNAYSDKEDYDRAIADYNQAITINPKDARAYDSRGNTYIYKGDRKAAIADYSEAITLNPQFPNVYFSRGRQYLLNGALLKALADLNQASDRNPKDAYTALWLELANKRTNLLSRLPDAMTQVDLTKWPAPVMRLYLGQLTPEVVLAAADNPDSAIKRGQVCEANFYIGELDLQQGKKDDATRLFRLAVADCPKHFIEFYGANAELTALGVPL